MRKVGKIVGITVGALVGLFVVLGVIGMIFFPKKATDTAAAGPTSSPVAAAPAVASGTTGSPEADACRTRPPAMGEVFLRTTAPTLTDVIQLGSGYTWNYRTNACEDPVQSMISTAPTTPGYCLTMALVSDNPKYDVEQRPAPALRKVMASAGPGC